MIVKGIGIIFFESGKNNCKKCRKFSYRKPKMENKMTGIGARNKRFSEQLLKWDKNENTRQMPWKGEKDPYKIWLSEIILQQTRVNQGLDYYKKFIKAFPDIQKLAHAADEKVFKIWEGLGYYTRCKNLLITSRYILNELGGVFPNKIEDIIALKGIGPYTAAAIASFAFNHPVAVVDGNVFRVLARVFGIKKPIDSAEGKHFFTQLADQLIDKTQPGIYNQAIMDLGAVICKPIAPLCDECPFQKICFAFQQNKIDLLPVKEKRIVIRQRWLYFFILEYKNKIAIRQRKEKDIWQYLFEFPLIETKSGKSRNEILILAEKRGVLKKRGYDLISISSLCRQKLSHQLISGRFFKIKLKQNPVSLKDWTWISIKGFNKYAFPAFINQYLKQKF